MIAVDSSVWIDRFNGAETRETPLLDHLESQFSLSGMRLSSPLDPTTTTSFNLSSLSTAT